MDNQLYDVNNLNTTNGAIPAMNSNVPFVQKLVFFLFGASNVFMALAIWFLFRDEIKYTNRLKYIKNGAIFALILVAIYFVFVFFAFLLGAFATALVA